MLGGEGGDGVELKFLARGAEGVADRENAGVEHAHDIPGEGLLNDLPLSGHELLGPGEAQLLAALDVVDLPVCVEAAGYHPHKGDPVPVGLVHIRLNFKDEGGEIIVHGVDHLPAGRPGQGGRGHAEKALQKGFHAEIGEGAAEEHGG